MARWEPDAQGRLERAALELFAERGYEPTTVAEIADRAGLTERTFFRHYADKREVLFGGGAQFKAVFVDALQAASEAMSPLQAVTVAVQTAGARLEDLRGRDLVVARQGIIAANPELHERELIKLADITAALAGVLRARGTEEPDASMTAELGMAAFRVALERWVAAGETRTLAGLIHEALSRVPALIG
jgi:AcrR family transcriptional regulator